MGALKLTYFENESPLKVLYSVASPEQKIKQNYLSIVPAKKTHSQKSVYSYALNNPLKYTDPTGNDEEDGNINEDRDQENEGWYRNSEGVNEFNASVHSQEDLNNLNISGSYIGETFSQDLSTGQVLFGDAQGNLEKFGSVLLNNVEVTADRVVNGNANEGQNNNVRADNANETWDPVTNQRIGQLDARLQVPAIDFINAAQTRLGVNLRVTQSLRTNAQQNILYAQGRTTPGNIVTNARGGESYHNYGLAFDLVVMRNGQPVWDRLPDNIGALGASFGFEWGGDWRTFQDYPHFQMTFGQDIMQLQGLQQH